MNFNVQNLIKICTQEQCNKTYVNECFPDVGLHSFYRQKKKRNITNQTSTMYEEILCIFLHLPATFSF